jgi:hypothetical protein
MKGWINRPPLLIFGSSGICRMNLFFLVAIKREKILVQINMRMRLKMSQEEKNIWD